NMKKLLVGLGIALALAVAVIVFVPGYRSVMLGKLRNERFYENRPVSYWLDGLTSQQDPVREHAAYVLGQIGLENTAIVAAVVGALKDNDYIVRKNAAASLGELGSGAASAVPDLITSLGDSDGRA